MNTRVHVLNMGAGKYTSIRTERPNRCRFKKELKRLRVEWDNIHKQNGCMSTAKVKPVSLLSASKLPIKLMTE